VKTKDTTKEVKTETNGDERIACDVCGKKIYKNLKHFLYSHHRINKKKAIGWLKNTGTTAAIAGNNSNINNPPTIAGVNSNLIFGLGGLLFNDDLEEDFY
ncbi:hypothetical protein QBC32DRAFT_319710, partial [Pseudoneurospora amorphoporcata]